jgi:hypothetical protein
MGRLFFVFLSGPGFAHLAHCGAETFFCLFGPAAVVANCFVFFLGLVWANYFIFYLVRQPAAVVEDPRVLS